MSDHFISITEAQSDLLSCAAYLAEAIPSVDGRSQAMMAVVPRYLAKGNVDLAAELANSLDDPYSRDRLLIAVAEKCALVDDDEYALQLAEAMDDPGMRAQASERIGLALASTGATAKALSVADSMDHADNVLAGIAVRQHADGKTEAALGTIGEIGFPAAAAHALMAMAGGSIEKDDLDSAVDLLEQSLTRADEIEHEEERIRSVIDIGNSFISAKRDDRAVEAFVKAREYAEILDNVHRDNFLAAASLGFLRADSLELADETLDSVQDKTQIATTLLGFSREFWRRGEKDEALEAIEESYAILKSQHENETRDSRARFALFANIAVQFAGFEKGERGIEIAQEIEDENDSMNALGQIARILSIQENDELSRTALDAIREDSQRMFALIALSDTAAANNDNDKAVAFLDEANLLAEELPQLASRSAAYVEFAKRFVKFGQTDRARNISLENLQTISTIRDESSQVAAIARLAELYEEAEFEIGSAETEVMQDLIRRQNF